MHVIPAYTIAAVAALGWSLILDHALHVLRTNYPTHTHQEATMQHTTNTPRDI